jgi:hypothetical protein
MAAQLEILRARDARDVSRLPERLKVVEAVVERGIPGVGVASRRLGGSVEIPLQIGFDIHYVSLATFLFQALHTPGCSSLSFRPLHLELAQARRIELEIVDCLLADANLVLDQEVQQLLPVDQRNRRSATLESRLLCAL